MKGIFFPYKIYFRFYFLQILRSSTFPKLEKILLTYYNLAEFLYLNYSYKQRRKKKFTYSALRAWHWISRKTCAYYNSVAVHRRFDRNWQAPGQLSIVCSRSYRSNVRPTRRLTCSKGGVLREICRIWHTYWLLLSSCWCSITPMIRHRLYKVC